MKIENAPQDVTVHGNFATSDFAVGDLAFIVDMFADKVYSHKERAVIRELACNAHDSHVMAGTTDIPFYVHLPTSLEPFFSIRDYGTGLDDREVRTIFAGIGISTKRDSNEVIGCFGIGSLSPYSMTDSFTVKSYKDGICRTYSCYRDEARKPVVALLVECETDETNGLEVSLSVNGRVSQFEAEAENVFRFWQGTIPNINNVHVVSRCKEQRELYIFQSDDFGLTGGYGDMYAIMGNISYRIPWDQFYYELCDIHAGGYLKFELGELDFDTARENLSMTDKVRAAVKTKFELVRAQLHDLVTQRIEAEPTPFKRASMAQRLNSGSIGNNAKIKMADYMLPSTSEAIEVWKRNYRATEKIETKSLPLGNNIEYYEYKPRMTQRIRNYVKDRECTVVLLTPQQISECQIDTDLLLDLDDLPKIERSYVRSSGPVVKTFAFSYSGSYYYGKQSDHWNAIDVDTESEELVYVEINRWEIQSHSIISRSACQLNDSIKTLKASGINVPTVHGLKSAYIKSKAFSSSNWIHIDDYVKREVAKNAPNGVYIYSSTDFDRMQELHNKIESPELTEWKEYANMIPESNIATIAKSIGIEIKEDTIFQEWMDAFFKKYPLVQLVDSYKIGRNPEAFALYIGGTVR